MKTNTFFGLIRSAISPGILLPVIFFSAHARTHAAVRINDNLVLNGDVFDFQISPDSTRVVWVADADSDEVFELYSRAIDGSGSTVKLNAPMVTGGDITEFKISPDSQRVVWRADAEVDNTRELYSRAIDGSAAQVKLNHAVVAAGGSVLSFEISRDSTRVVWLGDPDVFNQREMFSRLIDGSAAEVKLNDPMIAAGSANFFFQISPNSARVVWVADADTDNVGEVYSRAIDGSGAQVKLNDPFTNAGAAAGTRVKISPDSARVVWTADATINNKDDLFSRAIDGSGAQATLSGPLVPGSFVGPGPLISADSLRVVYVKTFAGVTQLFSRPIDGSGTEVLINDPMVTGGSATGFLEISPNSARVVWNADANTDGVVEIYTRAIDGSGTQVKLNNAMVAGGNVLNEFHFTADSSRVYWMADADIDTAVELYSRPADGSGTQVKVNNPLAAGSSINAIPEPTADGLRIVWRANADSTSTFELYTRRIDASDAQFKLNDPFVAGGNIPSITAAKGFHVSANGARAVYIADQVTNDIFELWSATMPSPPIGPVTTALGSAISGEFAPDGAGANDGTKYDLLKRGGFLGENGHVVFPAQLLVGTGGVTLSPNTFMGLWKQGGGSVSLLARSGNTAPEAGNALYDVLPQTPAINDSGEVTFLASLRIGSGSPGVTTNDDTGLWSELGGTGIGILMREGDAIPGLGGAQIGAFASGCFATAHTGASTGEAAFCVTMKNGTTDTAILRASIASPTVTAVGVVARESTAMPGVAGELFGNLAGSYTDSLRMDDTGNLCFVALSKNNRESIWFQPAAGGAPVKAFIAGSAATGDTAPGTGGATFKSIKSPSIGSGGLISFRGFLNSNGDNTSGLKGDGIWRGTTAGGFNCILRAGDDNTARPGLGLPAGALVGNLWHSWLTNATGRGAWKGWLDVNGNGTSSVADGDVHAIYSDLSGTMKLVTKIGDAAPDMPAGANFASFDLPVVGGVEQMAFLGTVTGGGTAAGNNKGVWRCAASGGTLKLVLRTGSTITTSQGVKTIANVDLPGSNTTDRRWEQPVIDGSGRLIVFVTNTDGSMTEVVVP
ncbi:MAG: hypothetical protein K1X78_01665 [Verrucomicrobiaceae bacterium]|nr:hypothetical protein [Verrucomicrobiaceae bacterium]